MHQKLVRRKDSEDSMRINFRMEKKEQRDTKRVGEDGKKKEQSCLPYLHILTYSSVDISGTTHICDQSRIWP